MNNFNEISMKISNQISLALLHPSSRENVINNLRLQKSAYVNNPRSKDKLPKEAIYRINHLYDSAINFVRNIKVVKI